MQDIITQIITLSNCSEQKSMSARTTHQTLTWMGYKKENTASGPTPVTPGHRLVETGQMKTGKCWVVFFPPNLRLFVFSESVYQHASTYILCHNQSHRDRVGLYLQEFLRCAVGTCLAELGNCMRVHLFLKWTLSVY